MSFPAQRLPEQKPELVLLCAERYARASAAMDHWAPKAKQCVDFVEGKQWSESALKLLEEMDRPAITINKIRPLVRLVLGYFKGNKIEEKFLPGHDGTGTDEIAQALTMVARQIAEINHESYVSTEVFMDGMLTGRGYYDLRMDYTENRLGQVKVCSKDPFAIYPDPDGDSYDPNDNWSFIIEPRWVSLDEIELYFPQAYPLIAPLVQRGGQNGMPLNITGWFEEITPWRRFGGDEDRITTGYETMGVYLSNAVDTARKDIRLLDIQHMVKTRMRVIEDMETGFRKVIPDGWDNQRVLKLLAWAEEQYNRRGKSSPLQVLDVIGKRLRWTTIIGDIIVQDDWSPYNSYTIVPYFPYFRRGQTHGMVHDLIEPQENLNKRESLETDIVMRTAHSGWKYHKDSLSPENKYKLERSGARPGFNLEWQGEPGMAPEKIEPSSPPMALERLKQTSVSDLKEVSLINDSLLGQLDRVQSGRAIEARQRQGVIGIQSYMDNVSRTRELVGLRKLELIQNHYTEQRVIRVLGESGKMEKQIINQMVAGRIVNDVTLGRYTVVVDETPVSKTFLSAQFEELVELVEKGIIPREIIGNVAIDVSSLPQKDLLKKQLQAYMMAMGMPVIDEQGGVQAPQQPQPNPLEESIDIRTDPNARATR